MILIILLVCLPAVFAFPLLIPIYVLLGIVCLIFYLPKSFSFPSAKPSAPKCDQDLENDLIAGKGFITYEEKTRRELSRIPMKKDFKNDPEWQRLSGILKRQTKIAEERENAIMLKAEQNEKCEG